MSKEGLLGMGTGTGTGTGETEEGCETSMRDMQSDINTFFGESGLDAFRNVPPPELFKFLETANPHKRPRLSSSWSEGVESLMEGDQAMQVEQAEQVSPVAANHRRFVRTEATLMTNSGVDVDCTSQLQTASSTLQSGVSLEPSYKDMLSLVTKIANDALCILNTQTASMHGLNSGYDNLVISLGDGDAARGSELLMACLLQHILIHPQDLAKTEEPERRVIEIENAAGQRLQLRLALILGENGLVMGSVSDITRFRAAV